MITWQQLLNGANRGLEIAIENLEETIRENPKWANDNINPDTLVDHLKLHYPEVYYVYDKCLAQIRRVEVILGFNKCEEYRKKIYDFILRKYRGEDDGKG